VHLPTEPRVAVPAELVRTALRDPALLARTLPGARLQELGDGKLSGTLALWVAGRAMAARGEAQLDPSAGDDGAVTWLVSADGTEGAGSLEGAVRIEVLPAPGGCRLRVEVTGHAARWGGSVPDRALWHTADALVGQFARNLEAVLIEGHPTEAARATAAPRPGPRRLSVSPRLGQTARRWRPAVSGVVWVPGPPASRRPARSSAPRFSSAGSDEPPAWAAVTATLRRHPITVGKRFARHPPG